MAWKKKEKELTPEEALKLAKEEQKPFWFGSPPLFAGVSEEGHYKLIPLEDTLKKKRLLLFFIDPTDNSSETLMEYFLQWHKRFKDYGIQMMISFRMRYPFVAEKTFVQKFQERYETKAITMIDKNSHCLQALGLKQYPGLAILSEGKVIHTFSGTSWFQEFEPYFHTFLRQFDPGLPLSTRFEPDQPLPVTQHLVEFGKGKGAVVKAKPATGMIPYDKKKPLFFLGGKWEQDDLGIFTSDPTAEICFYLNSSGFSIVAASRSKNYESSRLQIETEEMAPYDTFSGTDLTFGESGEAYVPVRDPRLYQALKDVPLDMRHIRVTFPIAKRIPTTVFGFRFFG